MIITKVEFSPVDDANRRRIIEVLKLLLRPNHEQALDKNHQGEKR